MGSALSKAPLQRLGPSKANEWSLTINHQAIFSDDHEHLPEEHRIVEGMWMMFRQNSSSHFIDIIIKIIWKYLWSRQSCPGMEHISYSTQPASSNCQAIMWGSLVTSTSSSAKSLSSIMWNSSYNKFILFLCHPILTTETYSTDSNTFFLQLSEVHCTMLWKLKLCNFSWWTYFLLWTF